MPELRTAILDIVVFFCSYILAPLRLITNRQIQVRLNELYHNAIRFSMIYRLRDMIYGNAV